MVMIDKHKFNKVVSHYEQYTDKKFFIEYIEKILSQAISEFYDAAVLEWKPMATVPRDGSIILLLYNVPVTAKWHCKNEYDIPRCGWASPFDTDIKYEDNSARAWARIIYPTSIGNIEYKIIEKYLEPFKDILNDLVRDKSDTTIIYDMVFDILTRKLRGLEEGNN